MSMDKLKGKMWLNGEFIPINESNVNFFTSTLHYGSSVFEGTRAYNGKIFKEQEHNIRLLNSAKILGLKVPYTLEEITKAQREVLKINNLKTAYIRPLIWFGSETMGLMTSNNSTNIGIAAWEWGSYYSASHIEEGLSLCLSPWKRPAPDTAPFDAKAASLYAICSLSKNKAHEEGFDDALMLDYRGYVAECSSANIFFIKGNNVVTPTPDCFLNGITRQTVINEILPKLGFKVFERHIFLEELAEFDQCFVTGTAAEVVPIGMIKDIAKFSVAKEVLSIREEYLKLVNS